MKNWLKVILGPCSSKLNLSNQSYSSLHKLLQKMIEESLEIKTILVSLFSNVEQD